jgi:uncharacterized protein
MPTFLTLPGIGGSGEGHWKTLWRPSHPTTRRFKPANWERPQLPEWVALSRKPWSCPRHQSAMSSRVAEAGGINAEQTGG